MAFKSSISRRAILADRCTRRNRHDASRAGALCTAAATLVSRRRPRPQRIVPCCAKLYLACLSFLIFIVLCEPQRVVASYHADDMGRNNDQAESHLPPPPHESARGQSNGSDSSAVSSNALISDTSDETKNSQRRQLHEMHGRRANSQAQTHPQQQSGSRRLASQQVRKRNKLLRHQNPHMTATPTPAPTPPRPKFYTEDTVHQARRYGAYQYRNLIPQKPPTGHYERSETPVSLVNAMSILSDPLRNPDFDQETPYETVDWEIELPYLGVLIDGGRHYFPLGWLKRVVDRIAAMKYNLIHLRLTDDQTFNVLLESRPELAYPTVIDNPHQRVWTASELRHLVQYAKQRGVQIMPEINMPGHSGAWAGGAPDLVTRCPGFTCEKGYGLPLNLTHPALPNIIRDVLNETMDIFDDPPFLHLGGDEVNMAKPCFDEEDTPLYDFAAFEVMLQGILDEIGVPREKVVRWEMTGQWSMVTPNYCGVQGTECVATDPHIRAGSIEQMWESYPYDRHRPTPTFFLSNQLYFDTNGEQDIWDVYERSNKALNLRNDVLPTALIVGTFELSTQFWFDRNILGRLLAVSMGVARKPEPPTNAPTTATPTMAPVLPTQSPTTGVPTISPVSPTQAPSPAGNSSVIPPKEVLSRALTEILDEAEDGQDGGGLDISPTVSPSTPSPTSRPTFAPTTATPTVSPTAEPTVSPTLSPLIDRYDYYCNLVGLGTHICSREGKPVIHTNEYLRAWKEGWAAWKSAICERLTYSHKIQVFKPMEELKRDAMSKSDFWGKFGPNGTAESPLCQERARQTSRGDSFPVKHVGVILDTTSSLVRHESVQNMITLFSKFDFDIVQLRVAGSKGFTMKSWAQPNLPFSMLFDPDHRLEAYKLSELRSLVEHAKNVGIEIIPEISFTSHAAGWYGAGLLADCPQALCDGELVAHDLRKAELLPVLFSVLEELGSTFRSSFLHLGHDDRVGAQACYDEAGIEDDAIFDKFEKKLGALLEFADMSQKHVLRYENLDPEENQVKHRAGDIRHYPAGMDIADIQTDRPFFVTVDVLDGSPLQVYARTRALMALAPMGIVAEVRHLLRTDWVDYQMIQRLIAFALGTIQEDSSQNLDDLAEFEMAFQRYCQLLHVFRMDCSVIPEALEVPVRHVTESAFWAEAECSLRTETRELVLAKQVKPFYEDSTQRNDLSLSNETVLCYLADVDEQLESKACMVKNEAK